VEELASEILGHEERDKERPEESRDRVKDKRADIDDEQDARRDP
jgi:hypothetical protein